MPVRVSVRALFVVGVMAAMTSMTGCKDLSSPLPAGALDPSLYATPEAALKLARGTRYRFMDVSYQNYASSGQMTDELLSSKYGGPSGNAADVRNDARLFSDASEGTSSGGVNVFATWARRIFQVRAEARLARNSLAQYAPNVPASWQSEMLIYEALSDIALAEIFCSGIPLSTVDFNGDFTYKEASTTTEVFEVAIGLLDSALVLSGDSVRIEYLARLGKARALTALGQYAVADTVVASVPSQYRFTLPLFTLVRSWSEQWKIDGSIADLEGQNGLPYRSSGDPRIRWIANGTSEYRISLYAPTQFNTLSIGTGVDARLVQAEAALHREGNGDGGSWLVILNALRNNGTFTTTGGRDTTWGAGTGGVTNLRPLKDPALDPIPSGKTAFDVRLDLIFRERAFWLYLTGRRQGDLRRLVRQYGRKIENTYPIGVYLGGASEYEDWIDIPISDPLNPKFGGCLEREANQS